MTKPVIGLTAYNGETKEDLPATILLRAYIAAILEAGGAPVLIPPELPEDVWQSLYARLDGVLFTGGGDIAIRHFGGEPHPRVHEVDDERDSLEFGLLSAALRDGRPVLGICRGCQVLNVGLGGTLYTHIQDQHPGALKHDYFPAYPRNLLAHAVRIEEASRLAEIVGEPILQVNSLHHQGIKDIAPALKPVAYAPDGLVEAVELSGHPFALAVQWHPEWLTDQLPMQKLFKSFVEACAAK